MKIFFCTAFKRESSLRGGFIGTNVLSDESESLLSSLGFLAVLMQPGQYRCGRSL